MDNLTCESIVAAHDRFCFFNGINIIIYKFICYFRFPLVTVAARQNIQLVFLACLIKSVHDLLNVIVGLGTHYLDDARTVFYLFADTVLEA